MILKGSVIFLIKKSYANSLVLNKRELRNKLQSFYEFEK